MTNETDYVTKYTDFVNLVALRFLGEVGESDFLEEMPAILSHPPVAGGVPEYHFCNYDDYKTLPPEVSTFFHCFLEVLG